MRRWIVFGCGAVFLGAAAWHFGKPMAPPPPAAPAVVAVVPAEAPKESPARIAEVIDLARAYEPVPEAEETLPGGVDPATFIEAPSAPSRIPYAVSDETHWFGNLLSVVRRGPLGQIFFGRAAGMPERIGVAPREVRPSTGLEDAGFWGFGSGRVQDLLFFEAPLAPVRLDVMPREVK